MVENINSILRPYLNQSKNQVTQKFLNLFAFYHNYRRYKAGKRKGKTPMEILIGDRQNKDWIELLTHFIETVEGSIIYWFLGLVKDAFFFSYLHYTRVRFLTHHISAYLQQLPHLNHPNKFSSITFFIFAFCFFGSLNKPFIL